MLTPHSLNPPIPLLRLLHDSNWLAFGPEHRSPTLEDPLVQIRRAAKRVISAPDGRGAVEAEHVAGAHVRHLKGQAHHVALGHEVGSRVDVRGDVVGGLGAEEREQLLDGVGEGLGSCFCGGRWR